MWGGGEMTVSSLLMELERMTLKLSLCFFCFVLFCFVGGSGVFTFRALVIMHATSRRSVDFEI